MAVTGARAVAATPPARVEPAANALLLGNGGNGGNGGDS